MAHRSPAYRAVTALIPLFLLNYFQRSKCAYMTTVIALLWLTEALPIAVKAPVSIFLFNYFSAI